MTSKREFFRLYSKENLIGGIEFKDGAFVKIENKLGVATPWFASCTLESFRDYWVVQKGLKMVKQPKFLNAYEFSENPSKNLIETAFWLNSHFNNETFFEPPLFGGAPKIYTKKLTFEELDWITENLDI